MTVLSAIRMRWYMWIGKMSGSMIYLDTHVLVWLYAGETALFPKMPET